MSWLIIYLVGLVGFSILHYCTERGNVHFDDTTIVSSLFFGVCWPPLVLVVIIIMTVICIHARWIKGKKQ